MSYAFNQVSFADGIQELSFDELLLVDGAGRVGDVAAHVSAVAGIVAGVALGTGNAPVAAAAGVVSGIAAIVAAFD